MLAKLFMMRGMFAMMGLPTCEEVEKFAYDFLDGALDPKTARKVERHLKTCKNCQRFILSYKKTVELGQTAPQTSLPDEFKERIFQFLMKQGVGNV